MDRLDSPPASASTTTVLHLNDDCLLEVFKYLNLQDLCSVADVCCRFRKNAQDQFSYSDFKHIGFRNDFYQSSETDDQKLVQTSRVLRNFGAYIKSVYNVNGGGDYFTEYRSKYHMRTIELMSLHCSESLIELDLVIYNMTIAIGTILRPVLANLRKLTLREGLFSDLFLSTLPLWTPELRELRFMHMCNRRGELKVICFDGLRQSWPKLTKLTLFDVDFVKNEDIDGFLMRNQQLKEIEIVNCRNIDDRIWQSIATHVPLIEAIRFNQCIPTNVCNVKHLNQLTRLRSLDLSTSLKDSADYLTSAVCVVGAAQIAIEKLNLSKVDFSKGSAQFVDGISKLKHLKSLRIDKTTGLAAPDICKICKSLSQLTKINLIGNELSLTFDNLLEMIRYLDKLETLFFLKSRFMDKDERICIDADAYTRLVQAVGQRRERNHLLLCVSRPHYTAIIPTELIKRHKDSLTLILR